MSNFSDAAAGLATTLEANVNGLKAFGYPVDSVNHFPSVVILPEPVDVEIAFGGNTFTGRFRAVFLLASADSAEGFTQIYDYIDPTETNKSIVAAVRADRTLDGKVDDADVVRIENIGRRELWGGFYFGFDAIVEFIKTVA